MLQVHSLHHHLNDTGQQNPERQHSRSLNQVRLPEWLVIDVIAFIETSLIFIAALFSKVLYIDLIAGSNGLNPNYVYVSLFGAVLCYLVFNTREHYNSKLLSSEKNQLPRLYRSLFIAFLLLVFFGYTLKVAENYSRMWFALWFASSFLALSVQRKVMTRVINRLIRKGYFNKNVAVYGAVHTVTRLADSIRQQGSGYSLSGIYTDTASAVVMKNKSAEDYAGGIHELIKDGLANKFEQIIIALPSSENDKILRIMNTLSILPVKLQICPDQCSLGPLRPEISYLNNHIIYDVFDKPQSQWYGLAKKIMDYSVSFVLLLLLFPLMLMIACAVKLNSKGPVFFRQKRHGYNHKPIDVIKFRTMTVMENGSNVRQATKNDDRVTKVGKFLRRTSLDELPQLINVLKGEMSLVGPRPHALAHNEYYSQMLHNYANRHKVKPGITGWAQINGFRGETNTLDKMRARAEADIYYIENWSIWMDIKILILTPFKILFQKNAY